jgi:hypothetical protein
MRIQNSKLQETLVGILFIRLRTILSASTIFSGHLLRQQPEDAFRGGEKKHAETSNWFHLTQPCVFRVSMVVIIKITVLWFVTYNMQGLY